jgi:hypothetical protein
MEGPFSVELASCVDNVSVLFLKNGQTVDWMPRDINVPVEEIEKQVVRASMAAVAVCATKGWDGQDVGALKSATRLLTGLLDV